MQGEVEAASWALPEQGCENQDSAEITVCRSRWSCQSREGLHPAGKQSFQTQADLSAALKFSSPDASWRERVHNAEPFVCLKPSRTIVGFLKQ